MIAQPSPVSEESTSLARAPVGLANLGRTCYMNVLIQRSFHFVCFRRAIIDCPLESVSEMAIKMSKNPSLPEEISQGRIAFKNTQVARGLHALKEIFIEMMSTRDAFVNPKSLIDALGLNHNVQEASHELWTSIFMFYFVFTGVHKHVTFKVDEITKETAAKEPRENIRSQERSQLDVYVSGGHG